MRTASSFDTYVRACARALDIEPPAVDYDRAMFRVGDRWIELRHHRSDDRVTFAGLVHMADPDVGLRSDLIARFNIRELFDGGFSLVEGAENVLYLCRPHQLVCLDPSNIRADLDGFARSVARSEDWYARSLAAQTAAAEMPSSDVPMLLI
jgi:hypothetical protein